MERKEKLKSGKSYLNIKGSESEKESEEILRKEGKGRTEERKKMKNQRRKQEGR